MNQPYSVADINVQPCMQLLSHINNKLIYIKHNNIWSLENTQLE